MKFVLEKLTVVLLLLFAALHSDGQIVEPVKWSYAVKKINDTNAIILLKGTILPGWHTYSQYLKQGGPRPTVVTFTQANNFMLVGKTTEPIPITKYEAVFNMKVGYFEKTVIFQQKIRYKKSSKLVVNGSVEYMACDNSQCTAPQDFKFNIPIR